MNLNNVYSIIGLCMKAGRLTSGESQVEKSIKDGTAKLVIVAGDASDNTKKKFHDMCTYRSVELMELGDKYILGKALGKEFRATISILDDGFAKNIKLRTSE